MICFRSVVVLAVVLVVILSAPLMAASYETGWVEGHNSRTRLLVGGRIGVDGTLERYAGLEMRLAPGWKTYWRQPGSAGGIPPAVDISGSSNVRTVTLRFPAPGRFTDPTGDTIGYKEAVVFPLRLELEDPVKPARLEVNAFFGVCREICIPAQASFSVDVTPQSFRIWPPELAGALEQLPVEAGSENDARLPTIVGVDAVARGEDHELLIDAKFPAGLAGADLFAETGDDMGLAMAEVAGRPAPGVVRFRIKVADAAEWTDLGRHGLRLTLVSDAGAVTVRRPRP